MDLRLTRFVAVAVLLSVVVGCQPKDAFNRQGVYGMVTYNGKPAKEGVITIAPRTNKNTFSSAAIVDGKWQIQSDKGLSPGEYGVIIDLVDPDWTLEISAEPNHVSPPDWLGPSHTITIEDGGKNEFNFDVENKNPPKYPPRKK